MLDIAHSIGSLSPTPSAAIVLGTPTECKELVLLIDFEAQQPATLIEAVTVRGDSADTFAFTAEQERDSTPVEPMKTLSPGATYTKRLPPL